MIRGYRQPPEPCRDLKGRCGCLHIYRLGVLLPSSNALNRTMSPSPEPVHALALPWGPF